MVSRLKNRTRRTIKEAFERLDYDKLGPIYCEFGGDAFWRDRRVPCERLGIRIAEALLTRLRPGGRSLYVGAGVAEIPMLVAETCELDREVQARNLRGEEVALLNQACEGGPVRFACEPASSAVGPFDHLWVVSVYNDPEVFPELSALSYGTANPVTFDPESFVHERDAVRGLSDDCLGKLSLPALVTTSVEEIAWIVEWCEQHRVECVVEEKNYPTAIVEDPICFIRIG